MWLLWSHFPTYLPPSFFPLSTLLSNSLSPYLFCPKLADLLLFFHTTPFQIPFSLLILSQTGWPLALLSYHTFSNSLSLYLFVPFTHWLTSCSSFLSHQTQGIRDTAATWSRRSSSFCAPLLEARHSRKAPRRRQWNHWVWQPSPTCSTWDRWHHRSERSSVS